MSTVSSREEEKAGYAAISYVCDKHERSLSADTVRTNGVHEEEQTGCAAVACLCNKRERSLSADTVRCYNELTAKGEFGLEMESLRVDQIGALAKTPHPFAGRKNITRDFCENQTEVITDVFDNIGDMLSQLHTLRSEVTAKLEENGELLWRFSNPPAFSDPDDIAIADFKGSVYRDYLAQKYGKVKMLLSGIHLNYSLPANTVSELARASGKDKRRFQDELYLSLAAGLLRYSWLIVYLTAASPVLDPSFVKFGGINENAIDKYASVRCSEVGYWNFFTPTFDFSSLDAYIKSIGRYIDSGDFISCSEIYYPIRVKPRGKYGLDELEEFGINHVELRMIDLNPLSPLGVFEKDIEFIHLLIIYLLNLELPLPDECEQIEAVNNMKTAALFDTESAVSFGGRTLSVKNAAGKELEKLYSFAQRYCPEYLAAVKYQLSKSCNESYSHIIRRLFSDDYMHKGMTLAKQYQGSDLNVHAFCGNFEK